MRLEVIAAPTDVPSDDYYGVQIGAFANYANAEKMRAGYESRYGFAKIEVKQGRVPLYRFWSAGKAPKRRRSGSRTSLARIRSRVFVVRLTPKAPSYVPRVSQTSGAAAGGAVRIRRRIVNSGKPPGKFRVHPFPARPETFCPHHPPPYKSE